jgi:hypothetical protein
MESNQIDVVLDLMKESPENDECGYYFVDHSERVIFWLDVFNMSTLQIWYFVPGIETSSHVSECPAPLNMVETLTVVEMALEIEYWSVEFRMVSVSRGVSQNLTERYQGFRLDSPADIQAAL